MLEKNGFEVLSLLSFPASLLMFFVFAFVYRKHPGMPVRDVFHVGFLLHIFAPAASNKKSLSQKHMGQTIIVCGATRIADSKNRPLAFAYQHMRFVDNG